NLLPADATPQPGDVQLPPCRRVLYRLPDLLAAPHHPIIVVEGEKDADLCHLLGLLGTTSVCGSSAWSDDYGQGLARRRLVVLPARDAAGPRYAGAVLLSCCRHQAQSVRLLDLPEPAKDLSDWFEAVTSDLRDRIDRGASNPPGTPRSRTGALKAARESLISL